MARGILDDAGKILKDQNRGARGNELYYIPRTSGVGMCHLVSPGVTMGRLDRREITQNRAAEGFVAEQSVSSFGSVETSLFLNKLILYHKNSPRKVLTLFFRSFK